MNIVVLHGVLSSAPVARKLPSGSVLHTLEVTTRLADQSAASVPVVCIDPRRPITLDAGDEVGVVGIVRRRYYRSGASVQSRTEVVADTLVPVRRPSDLARLVRTASSRL